MLKKIFAVCILSLISSVSFSASAPSVDLSGVYLCEGYDSHDGGFKNSKLTLSLDAKNSELQSDDGAYHYSVISAGGTKYSGEAAADGNMLAMYFENTEAGGTDDHGVSIGVVTHDENNTGATQTILHKFYYEPDYEGGGKGSEICIKQ